VPRPYNDHGGDKFCLAAKVSLKSAEAPGFLVLTGTSPILSRWFECFCSESLREPDAWDR
jgi:hypothetical protein